MRQDQEDTILNTIPIASARRRCEFRPNPCTKFDFFKFVSVFLSFFVALSAAQEKCGTDPSVFGFDKLSKLGDAMRDDFLEVFADNTRTGPFVYRLCPGVTFELDENKNGEFSYIYPLLDGTQIICGSRGESSDNCVIQGGDAQVILRESVSQEYSRVQTEFFGITFQGSNGISVAAWDAPGTKVLFNDCHWKQNTGQAVIQNIYVPYDKTTEGPPKRKLNEKSSNNLPFPDEFSLSKWNDDIKKRYLLNDEDLHIFEAMEVELFGCSVTETFIQDNGDIFLLINKGGYLKIDNSRFGRNDVTCNFISSGGSVLIKDSLFDENTASYSIAMSGGKLQLYNIIFQENSVHSDIITQESNEAGVNKTDFKLEDSCFLQENYTHSLIHLHPTTNVESMSFNFAENKDPVSCNIFFEDEGSSCFSLDDETCIGTCEEIDDKESCDVVLKTPTLSPTTNNGGLNSENGAPGAETNSNSKGKTFIVLLFVALAVLLVVVLYRCKKNGRKPVVVQEFPPSSSNSVC